MGNILDIGDRLREERERLGLSQTEFAERADVTRKTLFGYESGERSPSADALAAWVPLGIDVLYVITGSRSFSPPAPISLEHRALIRDYEASSPDGREAIRRMAAATALGASASRKVPKRTDFFIQADQVGPVVKKAKSKRVTINMGEKKK